MGYMCIMSWSLYNAKECDGCGRCEIERDGDWDRDYEDRRDEDYIRQVEREESN